GQRKRWVLGQNALNELEIGAAGNSGLPRAPLHTDRNTIAILNLGGIAWIEIDNQRDLTHSPGSGGRRRRKGRVNCALVIQDRGCSAVWTQLPDSRRVEIQNQSRNRVGA